MVGVVSGEGAGGRADRVVVARAGRQPRDVDLVIERAARSGSLVEGVSENANAGADANAADVGRVRAPANHGARGRALLEKRATGDAERSTDELGVERDVRAGRRLLVQLDGDDVVAGHERRRGQVELIDSGAAPARRADGRRGDGAVADGGG